MTNTSAPASHRHQVVVVGSGFGGLFATKALRDADVDVTMVAKTSHHLFQPLLYQVATGILSEGEIAPPTREILASQKNARVILGEVNDIDLARRTVTSTVLNRVVVTPYDSLIVAAGAGQSYFGNDQFAEFAPGMKSIDDALELRGRIFGAFELAEISDNEEDIERLLTFVVVGAGPTGVEMAGQIAELAHRTLHKDFRKINSRDAKIILLDAAPQVLPPFGAKLGEKSKKELEKLGVDVQLGAMVVDVDEWGIDVRDKDGTHRRIPATTKVWAAGVQANPLGKLLSEQTGAPLDRAGRIAVNPDLTLPTEEGLVPGAGSIQALLRAATDVTPLVIGKPEPTMLHAAIEILHADPQRTLVIGDRLDTDIAGAVAAGLASALVLTGVTTATDLEHSALQPSAIYAGLPEMVAGWNKV